MIALDPVDASQKMSTSETGRREGPSPRAAGRASFAKLLPAARCVHYVRYFALKSSHLLDDSGDRSGHIVARLITRRVEMVLSFDESFHGLLQADDDHFAFPRALSCFLGRLDLILSRGLCLGGPPLWLSARRSGRSLLAVMSMFMSMWS